MRFTLNYSRRGACCEPSLVQMKPRNAQIFYDVPHFDSATDTVRASRYNGRSGSTSGRYELTIMVHQSLADMRARGGLARTSEEGRRAPRHADRARAVAQSSRRLPGDSRGWHSHKRAARTRLEQPRRRSPARQRNRRCAGRSSAGERLSMVSHSQVEQGERLGG